MSSSSINRRDFLKALPLLSLPLMQVKWPQLDIAKNNLFQNPDKPNILILVFDTLSAKHVSLHGYNRDTTPNLARFAERATVFHSHYASANFTSPGTASLLTGTYPWTHRAFHLHGAVDESFENKSIFSLTPDNYYKVAYTHNLLVASLLHQFQGEINLWKKTADLCLADSEVSDKLFAKDYNVAFWGETLGLQGGGTPPSSLFLSMLHRVGRFALKRSLTNEYGQLFPRGIPNLHSLFFLLEHAIDWIKDEVHSFPQPFLGYFHLLPPHEPYTTRKDFIDVFKDGWKPTPKEQIFASQGHSEQFLNQQRREYDEYLAYTDSEFGRLLDSFEKTGLLNNTYLILTSDHGELFERGIRGHVTPTLYEPLINVPLLISKPGQQKREDVFEATSCVDIMPTLLHITDQKIPDWVEGNILPTFGDDTNKSLRTVYALDAKGNPKQQPLTKATLTIIEDQQKLIFYSGYGKADHTYEMYDLANDPGELENRYSSQTSMALHLQEQLSEKLQQINQPYV